jgi:zona occludens toxin
MITVLTGTPGAGKTLYAIDQLLFPLWDAANGKWKPIAKREEDGSMSEVERTVYTNINGFLVDHELVQADGDQGLKNWHKWAKPGSLIVVDEFQKIWPPRPNGSKVPDDVQAFDTHRHMGVDFILITQNAMNVDRHLHGLTGRHLHVRRMANMHLAIVYEWDHCSRQLLYSKSLTKHPWRYGSRAMKVYKSSELHTKQKRRLPGALWFLLLALGVVAYMGPTLYSRLGERTGLHAAESKPKQVAAVPGLPGQQNTPRPALPPASAPQAAPAPVIAASAPAPVVLAGCARMRDRCTCFDTTGKREDKPEDFCRDTSLANVAAKVVDVPDSLDRFQSIGPTTRDAYGEALIAWADAENDRRRTTRNYGR